MILTMTDRRPTLRTLRGSAVSVLQEAGAIRECDEHSWMRDFADPHARERAILIARVGSALWRLPEAGG